MNALGWFIRSLQMEKCISHSTCTQIWYTKIYVDVLLLQQQIGQRLTERNLIILRVELHFMHKIKPSSHQERFFIFWNLHYVTTMYPLNYFSFGNNSRDGESKTRCTSPEFMACFVWFYYRSCWNHLRLAFQLVAHRKSAQNTAAMRSRLSDLRKFVCILICNANCWQTFQPFGVHLRIILWTSKEKETEGKIVCIPKTTDETGCSDLNIFTLGQAHTQAALKSIQTMRYYAVCI